MSSRKCATICHISLICDMPLFIYKSKPHGNGPAAMKKDTIDKLIGRIDHIKEEDLQRFFVKLAEQQGFFQQVFEAIQEGLILLDNKGKILFVNKAALKLFDKERGQMTSVFSWAGTAHGTRSSRARPPSPGTRKSFTRNTDS